MKGAPLILLLVAGALFVWLETERGAERAPVAVDSAQVAGDAAGDEEAAQWLGGETALRRAPDGHFYAEPVIDGVPMRMMVDTGASVIALRGADAEALGLAWTVDELRPIARGAGGMVSGFPVMLESVQLGELELRRVQAVVIPEGLPISLLGQSFLNRIGRIEVTGEQMLLGGG